MAVNWLALLFIAQIVIFSTFMISFFTMESHRQAEQHEMQLELHRLRRDNLAKERKLMQLATRVEERLESVGMASDYDVGAEEGEGDLDGSEGVAEAEASSPKGDGCARLVVEWWVYEACLGQHVRQYHEADDKGAFEEHVLGKADAEGTPGPDQVYGRGDACPGADSPRQVSVRLRCREGVTKLSFFRVSEPSACQYVAELEGPPALCPWNGERGSSPPASAGVPSAVPAGSSPVSASDLSLSGTAQVAEKRQAVVQALQWSWGAYEKFAWGFDELKPVSRRGADWVGLGLTILDSLDVLWMAGLKDDFAKGVQWVKKSLSFDKTRMISFFETTIRCLGGLLAAHEMSGDEYLLQMADDLAERLAKAFAAPSGLPYTTISLSSGAHSVPAWTGGNLLLAEVGTVQMEFFSLAAHMNKPELREKAQRVFDVLDKEGGPMDAKGGRLWPIHIRPESGKPVGSTISWGAMGDSFYEYTLKLWLLTGKKHEQYKRMYLESVRGMQSRLITEHAGLTYLCEEKAGRQLRKMDHLVCFVPGTLALGAQHLPEVRVEHMALAEKLMETCHQMYVRQKTGLAPEFVKIGADMEVGASHNLLRPETVESLFYMWRFTKDPKYREWGWAMFLAFERHTRVQTGGYSGIRNVNAVGMTKADDTMQTFWLAETLKYFLMLFSEDDILDLDTHVINTEAHPLKVLSG